MRVTTRERGNIPGCIPVGHTPSLLEAQGIGQESTADQYCKAIQDYIAGEIDEQTMWGIMSLRRVV